MERVIAFIEKSREILVSGLFLKQEKLLPSYLLFQSSLVTFSLSRFCPIGFFHSMPILFSLSFAGANKFLS